MAAPCIHPRAEVHPEARLAEDVVVGPGAVIEPEVEVGPGCHIMANAVVLRGTRLGANCRVFPTAVLGGPPQDAKYAGEPSTVEIGEGSVIREGATVHRATGEGQRTVLGPGCVLMAQAHVGHNSTVGARVVLANGALVAGHVEIGEGAFLSGNACVHQYCRIGRLAMMGGNSAISLDLPPFLLATSTRGNAVGGLNTVGLRRAGVSSQARQALKEAFRLLYRQRDRTIPEVLDELAASSCAEVRELAAFCRASRRGVIRRFLAPDGP